jgi:ligand-binding sensor domain-containing protein/serine phosphatase RsbU (regulator of sigma subunit)
MHLLKWFVLSLLLVLHSILIAQQHIPFSHLAVDDGLSQSSVTCILQDKKGFIWFGTQDGLNRYDGYQFKIFKNIPSDSTSLTDNFIFSIYEHQSGALYIETESRTLHQYNPRSESFRIVIKDSVNLFNSKMSTVDALLMEESGIIWTGGLSKGTGLKRTDTRTGKSVTFKHDPANSSSLSDDKVYSIFRDRAGNLWVGTFNGLDRLDETSGKFIHYRNDPDDPNSLPDNWVWPIYEDSRGYLWIGTFRGGLSRFDPRTKRFFNYKNDPNDATSMTSNAIFSIYEDRSSVLWIGTDLGGLNYFHPSNSTFEHYLNDPGNKNSLNDNQVASMLVDHDGIYWIGTNNGGLNKFDQRKKQFSSMMHDPANSNSLTSNTVQSIMEDRSGILWIGSFNTGLSALDRKSGKFTHYIHDSSDSGSLSDNRIYALAEDQKGNIWIGTYGGGVNMLNRKTGHMDRYQYDENDSTTIGSNATWSLAFDDSGKLWIGTFGKGISVLYPESKIVKHFRHVPNDSTSLGDDNIIRVTRDSKGGMWFGTTRGLSRYIGKSNSFKNYSENEGLANNFVYGIVEDTNGNLWLSTNDGLSKFDPETEKFKNYYAKDGLQGNEFNQNAFAKDHTTGNILFGGANGFNVFHPDSLIDNTYIPPVEFTRYLRYNTDDAEGEPIVEKGISERDTIYLSYKDNIITLDFAALNYYNTLENQYRYKLEGFNENWIQLGNSRSVTFTNLSASEYNLRVMGSNNDGIWNEEGTSLLILVSPPWWMTKMAFLIYFITFFSGLYGVRRFEINRREQKAQIRESALQLKATEAEKRTLQVENERKTKELESARQLQLSMLPKELPDLPNLEIAAFMRTATEVGGDYYDFMVQEDGVLNVAFGDATGHGLQAGTMVTLMKGFFTSDASKLGFEEFLNHCSKVIKEINLGRILMSFSYLKFDKKKLQITSAGMPPIYYYHKDKNEVEEIFIPGVPLGAIRNAQYTATEMKIKSGDTILLLSDGLPELMDDKEAMFDYPRVQEHFLKNIECPPESIIEKLVAAGDKWIEKTSQDDDITLVVIRVK